MAFETGNTIKFFGKFRDWAPEGTEGPLTDPDGSDVDVVLYNADKEQIGTGDSVIRDSTGVYHYEWTLPLEPGNYYIEFSGKIGGKEVLSREKIQVKFNVEP